MAKTDSVKAAAEPTFPVESLIMSKRYAGKRDVLAVALDYSKQYTIAEADKIINDYLGQPVKEEINGGEG